MKLSKRSIAVIAAGAMVTVGVVACNHGMHFGTAEERSEWMVQKVSKELALNPVQQANLEAVKDGFLEMRSAMRSDREQTRREVLSMLQQPTLDRDKANAIVTQYLEKARMQSPHIIDAIGNFYDSLDDNQRAELTGFIRHKMEHHRRWHQ